MATTVLTQSPLIVDDSHQVSTLQLSSLNSQQDSRTHSLLPRDGAPDNGADATRNVQLSRARAVILIATLTGITFVGSMSGGLLTVGLPWIALDLKLADNLLLW